MTLIVANGAKSLKRMKCCWARRSDLLQGQEREVHPVVTSTKVAFQDGTDFPMISKT